jgi:hypothetical protein
MVDVSGVLDVIKHIVSFAPFARELLLADERGRRTRLGFVALGYHWTNMGMCVSEALKP